MVPPAVTNWVADSRASNHTTSDASNLNYILPPYINDPSSIIVENGSSLPVTSVGDTTLPGLFYLSNVLVTPDIIQNFLSIHRFTTDNWCSIEFDHFGLSMKDLSTKNMFTRCDRWGPLYTMRMSSRFTPSSSVAAPTAPVASASTWHHRLGHPGIDTMSKLSNASSIVCSRRTHNLCHACQLGRHTHIPFVSSASHVDNNFDLIHCDLWTSPIVSISGCKYYLVILDDHSHFVWTFSLCIKSDTFPTLSKFSPFFSRSLAAPSKPSSVTTVVSSTMPPPVHSLPPVGSSCGCPAHTHLCRMVKPSVLFALSIICSALCYFMPLCRLATSSKQWYLRCGGEEQGDKAGATPIDGKTAAALRRLSETELSQAVTKYARPDPARDVAVTYLLTHSQGPILI
jgi:hypothetical protein